MTAYFFGKKLNAELNVPIGLIQASYGGSIIEAWIDEHTLSSINFVTKPDIRHPYDVTKKPSVLYNAMINPFVGFTIKGVIWYQGESNVTRAAEYRKLMTTMIQSWRSKWQQGDFPFYFVQIAPFDYKNINSAFLREAQLQTSLSVSNTGMAVILDVGDSANIHPRDKQTVGYRLAYWALSNQYNKPEIICSGPVYKAMQKLENGKIKLLFTNTDKGLKAFNNKLSGFEIAGDDHIFHTAVAFLNEDNSISVWSAAVKNPLAVRYCFHNCVQGSLFNSAGLPASSFRTDDWEE